MSLADCVFRRRVSGLAGLDLRTEAGGDANVTSLTVAAIPPRYLGISCQKKGTGRGPVTRVIHPPSSAACGRCYVLRERYALCSGAVCIAATRYYDYPISAAGPSKTMSM